MPRKDDELAAQLVAEAQSAIRAMLAKKKPAQAITLTEMETLVGELGRQVEPAARQTLVNEAQSVAENAPTGPDWGQPMPAKGQPGVTVRGERQTEPGYYRGQPGQGGHLAPG